jgi:4-amino-4-deoxy-L-arabinose transferase-like glycosyltransferase
MRRSLTRRLLNIFLWALFIALVATIIICAGVPPVSRDALTHHLAVPKLYLQHGGIYEISSMKFSYYPMNLDLLYMLPLYFGNDILPKYIHFLFALFTAGLLFGYLRRRMDVLYALTGVLMFLSLPVIIKLSITVYVDLGLIFFSTAALMHIFKWIENAFDKKYLCMSAIWCGLALGTKYNGLIVCFLITLFIPVIYSRKKMRVEDSGGPSTYTQTLKHNIKALGCGAVFMGIALLIFSPWAIKNYIWTKNPVFPLFHQSIQTPGPAAGDPQKGDSLNANQAPDKHPSGHLLPFATRKLIYQESWWETLAVPLRIFFQGQDDSPKYFDGRLNPYLILLPILSFFPRRREGRALTTEKNILLAFAALFLLLAFFKADMRIRYIAPIIPPLVILSIFGLRNLLTVIETRFCDISQAFAKGLIVMGVAGLMFMNGGYVWHLFERVDPLSYLSGKIDREQYIERYRPEYAAMHFANENLPQDIKILCLFLGNRSYYSDRELLFGDDLFHGIVHRANSAEKMVIALKAKRITHVLIYYHVFKQWSGRQFEKQKKAMLLDFFNTYTKRVFAKGGYGLYQL